MLLDLSNSYDVSKAHAYLAKLVEKGEKCELKKVAKQRTVQQNKYLHVCFAMFCAETGYTVDEAKELFSLQLPDLMRYTKNNVSFRKSTTDLDTKAMGILIDKIRELSLSELGLYIPDAEEYLINKFQIERELEMRGVGV